METKMKFYWAAGCFYGIGMIFLLMAIPFGEIPFVPLFLISMILGVLCFFISGFLALRE